MTKKLLFCVLFFLITLFSFGQSPFVDSTPGTGKQWMVPAGVTSVTVQIWGAGGSGGGATGNGVGGGGGGGAYSSKIISVIPGQIFTYDVGTGGTGSNGSGTAGTSSTFSHSQSSTSMVADGGDGGTRNNGAGGAGGIATGGTTNTSGSAGNAGNTTNAGKGGDAGNAPGTGGSAVGNNTNGNPGTTPGGGGSGGNRNSNNNRSGGNGASGRVRFTYTPNGTYIAQITAVDVNGSSSWCPGETRTVSVTIRNAGTAAWTDSASADLNIGVKWSGWSDYHVRVDAQNLAPNATRTYYLTISAVNEDGTELSAGTNKLTFDVVYEAVSWFAWNANGVGPGNVAYDSPNQTILAGPANKTVTALSSSVCSGTGTNITVAASTVGVNYQLRDASNNAIGSPVAGNGGTISLPTGNLTSTTTFNVLATGCGSTQMTTTPTVSVVALPSVSAVASPTSVISGGASTLTATVTPATENTILLQEGFNGATNTWVKINNSTGGTTANAAWTLRPDGYYYYYGNPYPAYTFHSNDNSQFYLSNSATQGSAGTTATILQSPAINTNGYTTLSLEFYQFYLDFDNTDFSYVEVSTNGTSWTTLTTTSTTQGSQDNFLKTTVNLNAYINMNTVYVRFRYAAQFDWFWAIDNVTISGDKTIPYNYSWTATPSGTAGLPSGAGTTNSSNKTITVNPTQTTNYTVTATNTNTGCSASASPVQVTIAAPTITSFTPSSACTGSGASVVITGTNFTAATAVNFNGVGASFVVNSNTQITATLPASATTGTITVTTAGGTATSSSSFSVNPNTAISSQSTAGQTRCIGNAFSAISVTATGTAPVSYQWYSNTTASTTGGTNLGASAQSSSYTPSSSTAGTLYYYCVVTGGCSTVTSAVSGAFVVNPNTVISSQSTAGQTQCVGTAFSAISVTATGTAPVSYQWYSNTTASTTGGTNLGASAQTSSYTPSSSTVGTLYYYCIVTGGCSIVTSAVSGAFVVNPNTAISSQSTAGQTRCIGNAFSAISVTGTGTTPVSYQWYSNTTASTTGGTNLGASAQSSSYTPSSATAGTLYYYCVVTGGCSTVTSAVSGAFVVNPNTAISSQSTAGQTRCIGNAFSAISVTATGTAPVSYQWYSNTTASTTGGTNLGASAQSSSYTPSSSTVGTLYYYCIVTGGCSTVTSAVSGAFVVNPNTAISSQSTAGQTRCIGNAFSAISVTATGTAPVSYQWYSNTTASTTGGTNLGASAQSSSYTPSSATAGTLYYYCVVTGGCSTVNSAVSGAFVVNPNLPASVSIAASPSGAICAGASVTFTATSTNQGTAPTYVWYKGATIISGASGSTYTTNGLLNGDQISVQMTSNATPCLTGSPAASNVVTMTVNPNPSTPVASVTTQPNCGVPTGTITVTSPAPAAGINYSIDGSNYTNANGIFTGVAPGSYTVSVRNSSGCITSMATPLTVAMTGSKVWNGATDTNWTTATNWTPNGVPNNGDCVVIPDLTSITNKPAISGTGTVAHAYTLLVDDKSSLTVNTLSVLKVENEVTVLGNGSLVFEDKSSLLQTSNNSNTGNITYKRRSRPVRRYDFTYWTAPIYSTAYKLKTLSPATLGDKYYSYDVANAAWKIDYNGMLTMELAKGYSVRAPQTYDITGAGQVYDATFVGVPNNGTISAGTTAGKWNLIGNPYPSALDAEDFINLNLSSNAVETGALYFWTHKALPSDAVAGDAKYNYTSDDYAVFNLTGGTVTIPSAEPVDRFIGSGQGFFLKPTGTNSVIFTNAMRDQNNAQFFKTAKTSSIEKNRLWLNFTNDQGAFKQTLLGYMEGATNGIDLNYDATTMSGNTYVDFYSISNAKKLTVQARALPFDNTETIPLGYKTTIAGDFTIAIDHVDGFFTNQAVYLEDKTTSKIVDLRTGNYTFTSAIGTFTDRFVLRYTNKTLGTGDFENLDNTVLVSVKDKSIKVTSSKENIKEVLIYNVGGQDVYNKKKVNTTELQITNFEVADQVLLVKVTLENGYTVTKKIVFH